MYYLGLSYVYPMDNDGTSFIEPKDKGYRRISIKEIKESKRCHFDFSERGDIIYYSFVIDARTGKAIGCFDLSPPRPCIENSQLWMEDIEKLVIDIQHKIKKYEYEKGINGMKCRTEKIVAMWADKKIEKIDRNIEQQREKIKLSDPIYLTIHSAVTDFTNNMRNNHNIDIPLDVTLALDLLEDLTEDELLAKETHKTLEELETEEDDKVEVVYKLKDELMALLGACETYEQELEILFARKIIDDDFNIIT